MRNDVPIRHVAAQDHVEWHGLVRLATQLLATRATGCADDPEGKGRQWVGHAGEAYGLRSGLWIDRAASTGIVYYRTGLAPDPAPGRSAFRAAEERLFREAMMLLDRPAR